MARGDGDVWQTDRPGYAVNSMPYAGAPLRPATVYYWQVAAPDADGNVSRSDVSRFETGLMGLWRANWISDHHDRDYAGAPYFRKSFEVDGRVKSARLYVATGGLSVVTLNGHRVGDRALDPVYSRYDRRGYYASFDVAPLLRRGENVAGVVLGNGWYNHQALGVWDFHNAPWRNRPAFCMELRIDYADGSTETVATDLSWRANADMVITYN